MNITINGNATININNTDAMGTTTGKAKAQDTHDGNKKVTEPKGSQPIDRSDEVLIPDDTSFDGLMRILMGSPEAAAAAMVEAEEKLREEKESELRRAFGDDYGLVVGEDAVDARNHGSHVGPEGLEAQESTEGEGINGNQGNQESLERPKRRPGAAYLRNNVPRIALKKVNGGICEVFANGYAVYDNGDRKTVVWVPDCGTAAYHFCEMRDNEKLYMPQMIEVGRDVLGPAPWHNAIAIRGENQIWANMDHPKSLGSASDSDESDEWEVRSDFRWCRGAHFDGPEEAYIKKETFEERLRALTDKQRETYILYYEEGYNQYEIAEMLGITQQSVMDRLQGAMKKLGAKK